MPVGRLHAGECRLSIDGHAAQLGLLRYSHCLPVDHKHRQCQIVAMAIESSASKRSQNVRCLRLQCHVVLQMELVAQSHPSPTPGHHHYMHRIRAGTDTHKQVHCWLLMCTLSLPSCLSLAGILCPNTAQEPLPDDRVWHPGHHLLPACRRPVERTHREGCRLLWLCVRLLCHLHGILLRSGRRHWA